MCTHIRSLATVVFLFSGQSAWAHWTKRWVQGPMGLGLCGVVAGYAIRHRWCCWHHIETDPVYVSWGFLGHLAASQILTKLSLPSADAHKELLQIVQDMPRWDNKNIWLHITVSFPETRSPRVVEWSPSQKIGLFMEDSFEYIAMMKIQRFELLLRCHFSFEAKELVSWRESILQYSFTSNKFMIFIYTCSILCVDLECFFKLMQVSRELFFFVNAR